MLKLGLKFLFLTFTQLIIVILFYEILPLYELAKMGTAQLEAVKNIHPYIKNTLIAESILSGLIIIWGIVSETELLNRITRKIK